MRNWWLYVLRLEHGKYYVGITSKTPVERFKEHGSGFMGARWTKKYRPIEIVATKNLGSTTFREAELAENMIVRKYIKQYGIDNVRGGNLSFSGKLYRFGSYYLDDAWKTAAVIIMLIVAIIILIATR